MFKAADLAIVAATLLGPVFAVQAQKWLERRRDKVNRRVAVFRTLMATRAAWLMPAHVEALNAVPIEFHGRRRSLQQVLDCWKTYLDHLSQKNMSAEVWTSKRVDLFIDLLYSMSTLLGYNFSRVEISREVYLPQGHVDMESDQTIIRQGLAKLFRGEAAIPMEVKAFATDPVLVASQQRLHAAMTEWLNGQRGVKVVVDSDKPLAGEPGQA